MVSAIPPRQVWELRNRHRHTRRLTPYGLRTGGIVLFFGGGKAQIRCRCLRGGPKPRGEDGAAAGPLTGGGGGSRGRGGASSGARPSRSLPPAPARRRHLGSGEPEGLSSAAAAASASPPPRWPGCLRPGPGGPQPAGKAFRKGRAPPARPVGAGCVRAGHPRLPSALPSSPRRVAPPEEGASWPPSLGGSVGAGPALGPLLFWAAGDNSPSAGPTGGEERRAGSPPGAAACPGLSAEMRGGILRYPTRGRVTL